MRFGRFGRAVGLLLLSGLVVSGLFSCSGGSDDTEEIRNVLLISIDTCRPDYLSSYGFDRDTTPHLDGIAEDGVLFENAYSPVPMTLAAHTTLMTGKDPIEHGVRGNLDYRVSQSEVTLAEVLKARGLATAAFVGSAILGSQFGLNQGFDTYDDTIRGSTNERSAEAVTRSAIQWLDVNAGEPFFMFVHYYDPHAPYQPPEPFASKYADDRYAGEIAYTDHSIGAILDRLRELKQLDSTLIVVTSDHGEMLGEHGELTHGYFIYESAVRIPLIVKIPGYDGPRRIEGLAGLIDIPRTVYGLLGIDSPSSTRGVDLHRYLVEPPGTERALYCESVAPTEYDANPLLGLVTERWKYIETTRPEMYDLQRDAEEAQNLAEDAAVRAHAMSAQLNAIIEEQESPSDPDSRMRLDEEDRRRLESLGYVAGASDGEGLKLDPDKEDPKDLVGFHQSTSRLLSLVGSRQYAQAMALGKEMLEERPGYIKGYLTLAGVATAQGDADGTIRLLSRALELDPTHARAHVKLGTALRSAGKLDEAADHFRQALATEPDYPEALGLLGLTLSSMGRPDEAAELFLEILALDPDDATAHYQLGALSGRQGRLDEAIPHFREALRARPDYPEARYQLARSLFLTGQVAEALTHYREAVRLKPEWPRALTSMAWILATHPDAALRDPAEAVRLAEQASKLTQNRDPAALDALGAAYAASGRFDRAQAAARAAIDAAMAANAEPLANQIRRRLELYRQSRPYLEPRRAG